MCSTRCVMFNLMCDVHHHRHFRVPPHHVAVDKDLEDEHGEEDGELALEGGISKIGGHCSTDWWTPFT